MLGHVLSVRYLRSQKNAPLPHTGTLGIFEAPLGVMVRGVYNDLMPRFLSGDRGVDHQHFRSS